jgi:hypothetical protein
MTSAAHEPLAEVLTLVAERMTAARDRVSDLREAVAREFELHPFRTLASAAGAGYLLAGGLFSRLTLRLLSFGARLVLLPVIAAEIAAARPSAPNQGHTHESHGHHRPQV